MVGVKEKRVRPARGIKPKQDFVPLATASRFFIDALNFRLGNSSYRVASWHPEHPLEVPHPAVLAEVHACEDMIFDDHERIFLTRGDAFAWMANENRDTLKMIASEDEPEEGYFSWQFVVELGFFRSSDRPWAGIDHEKCRLDLHDLRFQLVQPTSAEIARFGKVVTP